MVELYFGLDLTLSDVIELFPVGPVVVLKRLIVQLHIVRSQESGTSIMGVKDGAYEPIGEEDILK